MIIAGSHTDPWELTHPGLVLGEYAEHEFEDAVADLKGKAFTSDWSQAEEQPVTTMIASSSDQEIILIENDREVTRDNLIVKGPHRLGEHVFLLQGIDEGTRGMSWHGISHHEDPAFPHRPEDDLVQRMSVNIDFLRQMRSRMHPGMLLVVTDLPIHPERRSASDFVIVTADA